MVPRHRKTPFVFAFLFAGLVFGCGSSTDQQSVASVETIGIAAECRGFPMDNLRYSPGGTALPNKCKPFDPTTNNPYAVRCTDVLPGYKTRYPGDEYCILPPAPDQGVQIGIHPQGVHYWHEMWAGDLSGYEDAAVTAEFEVAPGGEIEQAFRTNTDNEEPRSYYRIDSRMRIGSHHMATYYTTTSGDERWGEVGNGATLFPTDGGGFFWNSQRSDTDRPAGSLEIPNESAGLGMPVDAHQGIFFDVHHFNTHDVPILREAWINAWWVDGPVTRAVEDKPLVAAVNVPPGTVTSLDGTFAPSADTQVISLFGHRHAWTTRVNAWVHRADGTDESVYESFDWLNAPTYSYDSLSKNPVPNESAKKDGASSGVLTIHAGDELRFTCHVDTTAEHAAELGVPMPTQTLTFGNKAYEAEMCILYAQTTTGP